MRHPFENSKLTKIFVQGDEYLSSLMGMLEYDSISGILFP